MVLGWIVWVDARRRRARLEAQAQLHSRLLEKLASPQDVVSFLETEGGRRFLDTLSAARKNPIQRILSSVQIGVILILLGLAFMVLAYVYGAMDKAPFPLGVIAVALGAGFVISAAISYRLSKEWGLLPEDSQKRPSALT